MSDKRKIENHDDLKWVSGLHRYFAIEKILNSTSFEEVGHVLNDFGMAEPCLAEFKFYNWVVYVSQSLTEKLWQLYGNDKIKKDKLRRFFIVAVKRYRKVDEAAARVILKEETLDNDQRLLSSHCMFYVVGLGLGEIKELYDNYTLDFDKKDLVNKLFRLNQIRADVFHNPLSSRNNTPALVKEGNDLCQQIHDQVKPSI